MKNKSIAGFSSLLFFTLLLTFGVFWYFKISAARQAKKELEIERIESKTYENNEFCEQYALVALKDGWFPCLKCDGKDSIFLHENEIWKYGKTCNGEYGRYSNGLSYPNLYYNLEFSGTEKECLIREKEQIYNYPNLPECKKRNFVLLRPPGNKIDR